VDAIDSSTPQAKDFEFKTGLKFNEWVLVLAPVQAPYG
jgi:hypothetical protein